MSYHVWSIDGYGAEILKIDITEEGLKNLVKDAPKVAAQLEECTQNYTQIDNEALHDFGVGGIASVIMEVINEKEGIAFDACDDFDGIQYILLTPAYPWSNFEGIEKYRQLTEDKVEEILDKYIRLLDPKAEYCITYHSCENGG